VRGGVRKKRSINSTHFKTQLIKKKRKKKKSSLKNSLQNPITLIRKNFATYLCLPLVERVLGKINSLKMVH